MGDQESGAQQGQTGQPAQDSPAPPPPQDPPAPPDQPPAASDQPPPEQPAAADQPPREQPAASDQPPPEPPPPAPAGGGPVLSAIVPARGPVAGGTRLRLLGSGLKPPQSVTVGGTEVTGWTVVSDGEIQVTSPPGIAGPADVVVTVGGTASTGPAQRFEYAPAPVIHSARVSRRRIQVHGDDLTPTLGVTVGGAAAAEVEARGGVLSILPSAGRTGDVPVIVQTDGGSSNAYVVSLPAGWTRAFCFWLALLYFGLLLALLITYKTVEGFHGNFPVLPGKLPPSIPWFGALGAVALSLAGVTYHSAKRDWDEGYLFWHAVRPVMGAIFATVAYFIIAGGVVASGGTPNSATSTAATTPAASPSAAASPVAFAAATPTEAPSQQAAAAAPAPANPAAPQNLFYIVLAFIVGWREETFRGLLQRASDVLFGQSGGGSASGGGAGSSGGASGATPPPSAADASAGSQAAHPPGAATGSS